MDDCRYVRSRRSGPRHDLQGGSVAGCRGKFSLAAAQCKLFTTEVANFCVDKAMQIHGGYGYIGEFSHIEKFYRDQRVLEIYEGTSEIQRLVIAANVIGR